MSHPVTGSHSKLHQHLMNGNTIAVQGYSHVVCVRAENVDSWKAKDYEVLSDNVDSILMGKRKV